MGVEKKVDYYNGRFSKDVGYKMHYKDSFYYVHWTQILKFLKNQQNLSILEIGCGTGQLAHYLSDEGFKNYRGFDFSAIAIEFANRTVSSDFFVGDALDAKNYHHKYDVVICTEVLEHIKDDKQVLRNIATGAKIIFSVPNFDEQSHVRWFTSEREIKTRYFKLIDIQDIVRVGNIYIVKGIRSDFKPNFIQSFLATREKIDFTSFTKRIRHKMKNLLKIKNI